MKGLLWPDSAVLVAAAPPEEVQPATETPSPPVLEFRNRDVLRCVRIIQRTANGIGGARAVTRIEVFDESALDDPQVIFSVKHRHFNTPGWVRQITMCRNALWAATLAGCPVEDENNPLTSILPAEALRDYTQQVSPLHLHPYVEKALAHLRISAFTNSPVRLVWWRPIYHGVAVLINEETGRVLAAPCEAPTFIAAARAVFKALAALQLSLAASPKSLSNLPGLQLTLPDPDYEAILKGDEDSDEEGAEELTMEADEAAWVDLLREWAAEVKASPWLTDYVLKFPGRRGARLIRYSIDMSPTIVAEDTGAVLLTACISLQVHLNEPLSRETHAFPVCNLRFPLPQVPTLPDVRKNFTKALWFLRKLFSIHVQAGSY